MKRAVLSLNVFILFVCAVPALFASSIDSGSAFKLLTKADANTAFEDTDFSGFYSLVQDKPGQGKSMTEANMYRRDSKLCYTISITSPASDKGKGYIQYDNTLWFYDPHDNQFTFTSAKNKFQNTNANNSDFVPQHYSRDYKIESAERVKLGAYKCILFDLKAAAKNLDYAAIKLWVTEDDGLIRKKEDYSLSGQLLRTTAIPSYQKVGSRAVPAKMLIVDNLRGMMLDGKMQYEKTQITISNVSFAKQADMVYTKQYLELVGKKR